MVKVRDNYLGSYAQGTLELAAVVEMGLSIAANPDRTQDDIDDYLALVTDNEDLTVVLDYRGTDLPATLGSIVYLAPHIAHDATYIKE